MLGPEHPFTIKMESVLGESTDKVQGIMERQEQRAIKYKAKTTTTVGPIPRRDQSKNLQNYKATGHGEDLEELLEGGLNLEDQAKPNL